MIPQERSPRNEPGAMMQPLNLDSTPRTPTSDSVSLFAAQGTAQIATAESFGFHLHRSESNPLPTTANGNDTSHSQTDRQPTTDARPTTSNDSASTDRVQ